MILAQTYCPICGGTDNCPGEHRCKQSTLNRIDATMKQDREPRTKMGFQERLKIGFAMLHAGETGHY